MVNTIGCRSSYLPVRDGDDTSKHREEDRWCRCSDCFHFGACSVGSETGSCVAGRNTGDWTAIGDTAIGDVSIFLYN